MQRHEAAQHSVRLAAGAAQRESLNSSMASMSSSSMAMTGSASASPPIRDSPPSPPARPAAINRKGSFKI